MKIFLKFENEKVKEASFQTDGCGSSMICGSFAAELALGKKPDEVRDVTKETILETIGGLPEEEQHCALLAANTLHRALDSYGQRADKKENHTGD
jgi:nitrogen fixation NifU-like protein